MIRYYCSGFDTTNAFGHGLGEMLKKELTSYRSIVFIPGSPNKLEKAKTKYIPSFIEHFRKVGIEFENQTLITPDMDKEKAKDLVANASFLMLMGGDPFAQKQLCENLDLMETLKRYTGVMLGFSAGAMLMSKYIIITPCSEEYPEFHIEEGLNLDGISIYPHNNTTSDIYPDTLVVGAETYQKKDLIKTAGDYGEFYLLQDNLNLDGTTSVSIIKSLNGRLEFYVENKGKLWKVTKAGVFLVDTKININ